MKFRFWLYVKVKLVSYLGIGRIIILELNLRVIFERYYLRVMIGYLCLVGVGGMGFYLRDIII